MGSLRKNGRLGDPALPGSTVLARVRPVGPPLRGGQDGKGLEFLFCRTNPRLGRRFAELHLSLLDIRHDNISFHKAAFE
jgi:hypothetical protein